MYLDFLVEVPKVGGKITMKPKGKAVYVNYELGREYDADKKYNVPKRVIIGNLKSRRFIPRIMTEQVPA